MAARAQTRAVVHRVVRTLAWDTDTPARTHVSVRQQKACGTSLSGFGKTTTTNRTQVLVLVEELHSLQISITRQTLCTNATGHVEGSQSTIAFFFLGVAIYDAVSYRDGK